MSPKALGRCDGHFFLSQYTDYAIQKMIMTILVRCSLIVII